MQMYWKTQDGFDGLCSDLNNITSEVQFVLHRYHLDSYSSGLKLGLPSSHQGLDEAGFHVRVLGDVKEEVGQCGCVACWCPCFGGLILLHQWLTTFATCVFPKCASSSVHCAKWASVDRILMRRNKRGRARWLIPSMICQAGCAVHCGAAVGP